MRLQKGVITFWTPCIFFIGPVVKQKLHVRNIFILKTNAFGLFMLMFHVKMNCCYVAMVNPEGEIIGVQLGSIINPNSRKGFFVFGLSPRKGRGSKIGVPPWIRTWGLSPHNPLSTPGTPLGNRCPGSVFVPICDAIKQNESELANMNLKK